MSVKLAGHRQTLARHALFCGGRLSNFFIILGVRELRLIMLSFSCTQPVCSKRFSNLSTNFLKILVHGSATFRLREHYFLGRKLKKSETDSKLRLKNFV